MKIRPYLTFQGNCAEAIELYKRAFNIDTEQILTFAELPPNENAPIPKEFASQIVQATMKFGEDFIRLSDCGPGGALNDPPSERLSLAIETSADEVKHVFNILAEEGTIGFGLIETFYSPCAGVIIDKFGVMWNFVAQK